MEGRKVSEQEGVTITLATIYDKLLQVERKVDPVPATVQDHETRLRKLEMRVWMWLGGAAVAGGIVGQLGSQMLGS